MDSVQTGAAFLPWTLTVAILSRGITVRMVERFGPHRVLVACNPHDRPAALDLPRSAPWAEVAVSPSPGCPYAPGEAPRIEGGRVVLPSMGAGVWSAGG